MIAAKTMAPNELAGSVAPALLPVLDEPDPELVPSPVPLFDVEVACFGLQLTGPFTWLLAYPSKVLQSKEAEVMKLKTPSTS